MHAVSVYSVSTVAQLVLVDLDFSLESTSVVSFVVLFTVSLFLSQVRCRGCCDHVLKTWRKRLLARQALRCQPALPYPPALPRKWMRRHGRSPRLKRLEPVLLCASLPAVHRREGWSAGTGKPQIWGPSWQPFTSRMGSLRGRSGSSVPLPRFFLRQMGRTLRWDSTRALYKAKLHAARLSKLPMRRHHRQRKRVGRLSR